MALKLPQDPGLKSTFGLGTQRLLIHSSDRALSQDQQPLKTEGQIYSVSLVYLQGRWLGVGWALAGHLQNQSYTFIHSVPQSTHSMLFSSLPLLFPLLLLLSSPSFSSLFLSSVQKPQAHTARYFLACSSI